MATGVTMPTNTTGAATTAPATGMMRITIALPLATCTMAATAMTGIRAVTWRLAAFMPTAIRDW